jgi:hypothetical protein
MLNKIRAQSTKTPTTTKSVLLLCRFCSDLAYGHLLVVGQQKAIAVDRSKRFDGPTHFLCTFFFSKKKNQQPQPKPILQSFVSILLLKLKL